MIARVTGRAVGPLREEAKLDDMGLSSLDRVELLGALEDRYQVDLSEAQCSALQTVGDMERMLREKKKPLPTRSGREGENGGALAAAYHYPNWTLRWPVTWVRLAAHYLRCIGDSTEVAMVEGAGFCRGEGRCWCSITADVDPGFILTALRFSIGGDCDQWGALRLTANAGLTKFARTSIFCGFSRVIAESVPLPRGRFSAASPMRRRWIAVTL
jgi:acyl carrier protein